MLSVEFESFGCADNQLTSIGTLITVSRVVWNKKMKMKISSIFKKKKNFSFSFREHCGMKNRGKQKEKQAKQFVK